MKFNIMSTLCTNDKYLVFKNKDIYFIVSKKISLIIGKEFMIMILHCLDIKLKELEINY